MKKILKLLIATMLVMAMAVCVTACGGKTMDKVFDSEKNETIYHAYNKASLADLGDYEVVENRIWNSDKQQWETFTATGAWMMLKNVDDKDTQEDLTDDVYTYVLYNWEAQKEVAKVSYTGEDEGNPFSLEKRAGVVVGVYKDAETDEYTIYYSADASQNVGKLTTLPIENSRVALAKVGNYIFAGQEDGTIKVFENANVLVNSIKQFKNGYYYAGREANIIVYDSNLNLVGNVEAPSYAVDGGYHILSNGNVLFQYFYLADQQGVEYDYIDGDEKLFIDTIIFDVETKEVKNVEINYYLDDMLDAYDDQVVEYGYSDKIDNLITGYEIINQRIDDSDSAELLLNVSNDGKISVIEKAFALQDGAELTPVAGGYFYASNIAGETILLNAELEQVAKFTNEAIFKNEYIRDGLKFYKTDGTLIIDCEKEEYSRVKEMTTTEILKKIETEKVTVEDQEKTITTTTYYLLDNGKLTEIAKAETDKTQVEIDFSLGNESMFTIKTKTYNEEKKTWNEHFNYAFYAEDGAKLSEIKVEGENPDDIISVQIVAKTENATLIKKVFRTWDAEKEGGAGYGEAITEYYVMTYKA